MADILTEKLESFKSFRVDAYCEGYPDVIFEIILDAVPTREQTEIAVKALEKFVYTYNIFHFLQPILDLRNAIRRFFGLDGGVLYS